MIPARVTVVIAADSATRDTWRAELRAAPDLELVGEDDTTAALEARVCEAVPDVVLVSTDLPGLDAVALCAKLDGTVPAARVVLVAGRHDAPYDSVAAGAAGAVTAGELVGRVADAVRRTAKGEALVPPQWAEQVLESDTAARLTATEREVLQRVAKGASFEAIAALHEVPPRLVHLHAGYALAKVHREGSGR